jgi:hypothetical protein
MKFLFNFFNTVHKSFKFNQIQSCYGCQSSFLNTRRFVAENLNAFFQVFADFLQRNKMKAAVKVEKD